MTWKNRLMAAGLAAAFALPGAAMAQPMGRMHHEMGYLGFLQGVQLTSAQKTQMHEIMKQSWTQMKTQMEQLRALHQQIQTALASTTAPSEASLDATLQQQDAMIAQVDSARLATAMQVRAMLTPAQLAQSESIHQQVTALHTQMQSLVHPGMTAQ